MSKLTKLFRHPVLFFTDAARKRGVPVPRLVPSEQNKNSKSVRKGGGQTAGEIPGWYRSQIGPELKSALAAEKPIFLYLPWIAEHGDALMSRIAGDAADFTFAPFDLWHPSEDNAQRKTINAFTRNHPDLYRRMVVRRLVPLRGKIKGFVFTFDWSPLTRIIANVCEELEIPRILIPHESVFIDRDKYYWHPVTQSSLPTCDIILGWGDLQREIFCERGYQADRFVAVGAPKFDIYARFRPYLSREQYCRLFGFDAKRKIILFASQPLDSQTDMGVAQNSQRQAIRDLLNYAVDHGVQLLVRLPPSKDDILGRALREMLLASSFGAIDDANCYMVPPEEALYHADVVTSINSTMLFEAVLLGRPALSLRYVEFEQIWEKAGVPSVSNAEELSAVLPVMLSGDWRHPSEGIEWAAKNFGSGEFDGQASRRIHHCLANLISNGLVPYPNALDRVFAGEKIDVVGIPGAIAAWETTQRYMPHLLGARSRVYSGRGLDDAQVVAGVDLFVQWGITPSKTKMKQAVAARALGRPLLIIEDGFIRSVEIGLSGTPGLSLILDDTTAYYDATRPSRLQRLLENGPELTTEEVRRSRAAIDQIVRARVSKYNHAPNLSLQIGALGRKKLLLVDQSFGDQSIESGLAGEHSFERMLNFALTERSDCDIIVKQHPDAIKGGKSSYFSEERLLPFTREHHNLHPVLYDVNPYSLFDLVDEVFVVTSGMGFEALMAGKRVHCFGAPFYAGWGATIDHLEISGRTRKRCLEELFHFSYIVSSRYYHPDLGRVVDIEDMVEYIVRRRGWNVEDSPFSVAGLLDSTKNATVIA